MIAKKLLSVNDSIKLLYPLLVVALVTWEQGSTGGGSVNKSVALGLYRAEHHGFEP